MTKINANHMLYHVADIKRALKELRRMLRPGGSLCTATNGLKHMLDLQRLLQDFDPEYKLPILEARRYTLENGADLLSAEFDVVDGRIYEDNRLRSQGFILIRKSQGVLIAQ
jgi:ubiquinone/menaquinone biosynthesis C-methylase UbiE